MTEPYEVQEITCEEAQLQMTYMWADDPETTSDDDREIFGAHLSVCRKCYNEFQETIWLANLFKWYAKEGKQLLREPEPVMAPTTTEEPEEAVERRIPECKDYERPQPRRRLLRWLMPIPLCCLVIGVLCWWSWPRNNVTTAEVRSDSAQMAESPQPKIDNALAKESSVGGLESSPNGGDGPSIAAVDKDLKDTDS